MPSDRAGNGPRRVDGPYPNVTAAERQEMSRHLGGGWPGYLGRLRVLHRPKFVKGQHQPIVYNGCTCDDGLCPIPHLLLHIEDVRLAYEMKVDDLRKETLRNA